MAAGADSICEKPLDLRTAKLLWQNCIRRPRVPPSQSGGSVVDSLPNLSDLMACYPSPAICVPSGASASAGAGGARHPVTCDGYEGTDSDDVRGGAIATATPLCTVSASEQEAVLGVAIEGRHASEDEGVCRQM